MADLAIYLLSLAEMTGVDLQDHIEAKMPKNATRVYQRLPNGASGVGHDVADHRIRAAAFGVEVGVGSSSATCHTLRFLSQKADQRR